MAERNGRRGGFAIALALVLVGLVLGLLTSWPLPKYLTTGVPYTMAAGPDERISGMVPGDHLQYMYHLGQLRLAGEGRVPWFRNTYEFAGGYGFTEFYVYFPTALLYWPLSYVGEALAYNAILLLSFVGTMVAGYGLARAWGANRAGAFCAGVILTVFPARLDALFGGQPAGSAFFLFPMAWWGLEKNWQTRRAAWGWLAAACLVLLARLEPHHLFYLCTLLPLWAFWKLAEAGTFAQRDREGDPSSSSRKRRAVDMLPALGAALLAAGCVHYNQIRLHVIPGFGPQIIALAVFFLLVVLAVRWLIARIVEWLGVTDESFRRLWIVVPWLAFWLLAFYFLAGATDKEGYGIRIVRACVVLFVVAHVVFLVVAANSKLLRPGKIKLPWRQIFRMWPVFIGLAVAVAYELYLKTAVFDVSGVKGGRTLYEIRLFSVPFGDLFERTPGNAAFIGWYVPLFLIVGSVQTLAIRPSLGADRETRRRLWVALSLYASGVILVCGPLLGAYLPLYETLYSLVPFFSFTRAPLKFSILTATFGGVAMAIALTHHPAAVSSVLRFLSFRWCVRSSWPWAIAIACWAFLDSVPETRIGVSVLPDENRVYDYVAEHSNGAPLLEIPIWPGDSAHSAVYQYWTLRTNVPTVNGYSPTVPRGYVEHVSWPLYDVNYGRFGPREAELCRKLGVRFISLHEEIFPRKVSEFPATQTVKMLRLNPHLKLVSEDGPIHLFEILDEPRHVEAPAAPFLSRYVPTDHLKKHVGTEVRDDDALDGRAWASDGRSGQLFYGPFAVLPTGKYVAIFRIKAHAANPEAEIGVLDVYAKRDRTPAPTGPLVEHRLIGADWMDGDDAHAGYRFVEIPFELEGTWVVETRGWFAGNPDTSLAIDYVFIQSKPTSDTIRIEAEEMFCRSSTLVDNAAASQGLCLALDAPAAGEGPRFEERFLLLDEGRYRITCVARSTEGDIGAVVFHRGHGDGAEPLVAITCPKSEGSPASSSGTLDVPERSVYGIAVTTSTTAVGEVDYVEVAPGQ